MLPNEVLLDIFDFYVVEAMEGKGDASSKYKMKAYLALVHVCQCWRRVIFGSPHRLGLKLVWNTKTPVRDALDVWPALPLVIEGYTGYSKNMDTNIIALLNFSERINQIELWGFHLEDVLEAMEVPFPNLTELSLTHMRGKTYPLSDSFLGGSAPELQFLELDCIPFPGLPMLLSSATHLTNLRLERIPHSGYISPEVMVDCIATLTSLYKFTLEFKSSQSRPDRESRRPPFPNRIDLPVLTEFRFRGACEYLEDLVARVDAPRLKFLSIAFFNDTVLDTPQLNQFLSRTPASKTFYKRIILS